MIILKLFLTFFKIGLFSFGGGYVMLPMIYQEVQTFDFMPASEFSDLVALSQITPGPIAINAATYVGFKCAGFLAAAVSTIGIALPSVILMSIVVIFMQKFSENTIVKGVLGGIRPASLGLIMASAILIANGTIFTANDINAFAFSIAILSFLAAFFFKKLNSIYIISICGLIGALVTLN